MARPKISVSKLDKVVEDMILAHKHHHEIPTDYVLLERTGETLKTLERWYDGKLEDGESRQYQEIMQKLVAYRSHIVTLGLLSGSGVNKSNLSFLSKQKMWGGFSDSVQRVETSGKQELVVKLTDQKGKPLKHGK